MKSFSLTAVLISLALIANAQEQSARPGILQLTDGSTLHGGLRGIDSTNRLTWGHPAAKSSLDFSIGNMASVRFEDVESIKREFTPSARFQFKNGDELVGNVRSIKDNTLSFQSWFSNEVRAPLPALESILFSARGYNLLYEGPTGTNGWRIGRNPRSWEYKEGAFIANGADLLGRDFGLKGSSTLEFDLAWNGAFSLSITLYASVIDRFDYSSSAYLVYLGTGVISVQRVQAGSGAVMLGQTQIPDMFRRNKMRFEIRCNKEDATITMFADGKLVQRWKDTSAGGFVAKGGGIVFFSQVEGRSLKISNLRVSEWDGRFEPESMTNLPPNMDVVFLANRDKVFGKVLSLEETKATVEAKQTKLDIPLERVTQIRFAKSEGETSTFPGEVRASFPGGESIVFTMDKWNESQVSGQSRTFGPVAFDVKSIREVQFNLDSQERTGTSDANNVDAQFLEAE
ncbi:MAG TPA: hypothetical protein VF773_18835 [Verrucomicrobiae bacterium]